MTKTLLGCVLAAALAGACAEPNAPPAQQAQPPAAGQDSASGAPAGTTGGSALTSTPATPATAPTGNTPVRPPEPGAASTNPAGRPAPGAPVASAVGSPAAAAPRYREITIPAGTPLSVTLETPVGSDTSRVEESVRGRLAKPLVVDGYTAVPAGAVVTGSVTEAVRSGKVKGRASVALRFHTLTARDEQHDVVTARIARRAAATTGRDAKRVGIGTGAGAVIGAIAGGGKGAAIGGAVGAGAGTGVVMATRGDEVHLPAGTTLGTTLQQALKLSVPIQ